MWWITSSSFRFLMMYTIAASNICKTLSFAPIHSIRCRTTRALRFYSRPTKLEGAEKELAIVKFRDNGWNFVDKKNEGGVDAFKKSFLFTDFIAAFGFMSKVAMAAEKLDHHPECKILSSTLPSFRSMAPYLIPFHLIPYHLLYHLMTSRHILPSSSLPIFPCIYIGSNVYNRVDIVLSTHDCQGLSVLDIKLGTRIDEYAISSGHIIKT